MYENLDEGEVDRLINHALDNGITFVDTAPFYGHGTSEKRVGRNLATRPRDQFVLSTKVGRILVPGEFDGETIFHDLDPFVPVFDYTPGGIRKSFEDSLERLGLDRVDILFIHDPDDHMDQAIGQAYPELDRMRQEGLVASIGVGTNLAEIALRFAEETDIDVVLLAGRYTVLDQIGATEFLPKAVERNISVLGAGVYNSGVLVTPVDGSTYNYAPAPQDILDKARTVHEILAPHGVSPESVGLQFPLRHPAVKAIVTGVRSVAELVENIAAFDAPIPDGVWLDLESAGIIAPLQP
jgi:D-threo-aldose 1-dehydrogenase